MILPHCSEVAGELLKDLCNHREQSKFAPIYRGSFCETKTQTCFLSADCFLKMSIEVQVIFC